MARVLNETVTRDTLALEEVAKIGEIEAVPLILDIVCRTTGLGFAAVARVTEKRWIACAVQDQIAFGLQPGGELKVETTLCNEVRSSKEVVVIDDALSDPHYCGHPTPEMYGFRSYISVPIVLPDGSFFGTLCAIDPKPARLNTHETLGTFKLFADLIGFHLGSYDRLAASEAALDDERRSSELREQFIAVLGHDLRNPLAAVASGTRMLLDMEIDDRARHIATLLQRSATRMSGLVDNVMEFARARLGDGLGVTWAREDDLAGKLEQVIDELRESQPERVIDSRIAIDGATVCDSGRISQLLSNLVANALTHGDPDSPVRVEGRRTETGLELAVTNKGDAIPPEIAERLFQPFSRASVKPSQQGLGLGLYIASEVARSHNGSLSVDSRPGETRFTFRMPHAPPPARAGSITGN